MGREQSVLRSCESFPTDTSEESVDSETESDHSSSEEENLTEESRISVTQDTIDKQTKDYFTDPKSFADIDDFTNTTMEELDENDKEYEEQLKHDKSDLKDIYLYSTGERIRGTKASAILLKWHIKTNHINKKYLFQLADRIDGMEELRRLSKKTPRNSKKRDLTAGSIDFMEI
mmetsp:Transcript_17318/g.57358  ORF Transcript_17318/g.57358 Transcript_17318/m.57358 type:complete len:174 (-) Transcript_17318:3275-3796(-)